MTKSFQDWEDHFGDFSFCESDLGATQTDIDLYERQSNTSPDSEKYPNFARWYKTVKASVGGLKYKNKWKHELKNNN